MTSMLRETCVIGSTGAPASSSSIAHCTSPIDIAGVGSIVGVGSTVGSAVGSGSSSSPPAEHPTRRHATRRTLANRPHPARHDAILPLPVFHNLNPPPLLL